MYKNKRNVENKPRLETTQIPINSGMDKQMVVHSYNAT